MTTELPNNWTFAPLGDVCKTLKGKKPKNSGKSSKVRTIPYINIKAFETGLPVEYAEPGDYPECSRDDVLIVWDGARSGLTGRGVSGYIGSTLSKIWSDVIDNGYLYYFLQSQYDYINTNTKGVGIPHVDPTVLFAIDFPIAPQNEQKRIVAEIEKQFSRLDEAVDNLKRVKANLKRYKASVLKAAVEGKLTEEWRKKHPDVEPADKLLQRILAERRKKWEEAELAKMRAKGKEPKDDKWKKKYKELSLPNIGELPSIPSTWAWATLPQLGELNRGKSKHRPRNDPILYDGQYPFIQTGDIRYATGIINQYTQTYSEKGLKQSRLWPKGTLCITIAANIADTALLGLDACFPDSVVGFIPDTDYIDIRLVEYFIRTAKEDLERYAPATAQKNINLAILSNVAVPLPPEKEQQIIIDEIEKSLSVAEGIEVSAEQNMLRAERLRQSILKKAFSGKLVPQNSSDKS